MLRVQQQFSATWLPLSFLSVQPRADFTRSLVRGNIVELALGAPFFDHVGFLELRRADFLELPCFYNGTAVVVHPALHQEVHSFLAETTMSPLKHEVLARYDVHFNEESGVMRLGLLRSEINEREVPEVFCLPLIREYLVERSHLCDKKSWDQRYAVGSYGARMLENDNVFELKLVRHRYLQEDIASENGPVANDVLTACPVHARPIGRSVCAGCF